MPEDESSSHSSGEESDEVSPVVEKKSLDSRFSKAQLLHLQDTKDTYRYSTAAQRKELAQETYEKFMADIAAVGWECSKDDAAAVNENVRLWYQQRARSRRDEPRWGIPWNARQVFYKENIGLVMETQARMYANAIGVEPTDVLIEPAELDAIQEEDEGTPTEDAPEGGAKALKPFNFFQKALTEEWEKIGEKQQKKYAKMATLWREQGPNEEERRRLAETRLIEIMTQISKDVYAQLGVRLVSLASYTDTKGELCVTTLDFNHKIDGGKTFKSGARAWWAKADPETAYGQFVVSQDKEDREIDKSTKAELVLDRNEFGEPILPDPSKIPTGMKPHKYYVKLIRAFVRGVYATAKGVNRTSREAAPPWGALTRDLQSLVDRKYFPSKFEPLTDPNIIRVERAGKILNFWYKRQEAGKIPFTFHHYIGSNDEVCPRVPRALQSPSSDSDESESMLPRRPPARRSERQNIPKPSAAKSTPEEKSDDDPTAAPGSESDGFYESDSPAPKSQTLKKKKAPGKKVKTAASLSAKIGAKKSKPQAASELAKKKPKPKEKLVQGPNQDVPMTLDPDTLEVGRVEDVPMGSVPPADRPGDDLPAGEILMDTDISGSGDTDVQMSFSTTPATPIKPELPQQGDNSTADRFADGMLTPSLARAAASLSLSTPQRTDHGTTSYSEADIQAMVREQVAKMLAGGLPQALLTPPPDPTPPIGSTGKPDSLQRPKFGKGPSKLGEAKKLGSSEPSDSDSDNGEGSSSGHANMDVGTPPAGHLEHLDTQENQDQEQQLESGGPPVGEKKEKKKRGGRKANAEDRALLEQADKHGKSGKRARKPTGRSMGK
ncbi:hypothetical protein DFP72DRAFT_1068321 [Ephemerocybe angulata]|uniref:Uncharacterized protein n=1 Tax=Ephemerocybe angulata TaxID=980116 RepID=A0A8H6M3Y7_9AGAR|nr:hypothetical protein DFP72DRAFT_1068321 [Tulosesus angulatus]